MSKQANDFSAPQRTSHKALETAQILLAYNKDLKALPFQRLLPYNTVPPQYLLDISLCNPQQTQIANVCGQKQALPDILHFQDI